MLKKRLLTALVLVPLVVFTVFAAPAMLLAILLVILMALACFEWASLCGLTTIFSKTAYTGVQLLIFDALIYLSHPIIFYAVSAAWFYFTFYIIRYPQGESRWGKTWVTCLWGTWLLPTSFFALFYLREVAGAAWLMFFLLLVWLADSGAYFAGKFAGKRHLLPRVSPKKTVEGVLGGITCVLLLSVGFTLWQGFSLGFIALWCCWAIIVGLYSVLGDLLVSMLKRHAKVKDSGYLLPGHGGILDRIDSMLAAAPWFLMGFDIIGKVI